MAYKGEDIPIIIEGDSNNNLDELEFQVVFYPHDDLDNKRVIRKSELKKNENNVYSGVIPYSMTMQMPIGYYSVEVLTVAPDTGTIGSIERRIFKKDGAFILYDSASKNLM
jgi:hypothetical protein